MDPTAVEAFMGWPRGGVDALSWIDISNTPTGTSCHVVEDIEAYKSFLSSRLFSAAERPMLSRPKGNEMILHKTEYQRNCLNLS
jgi:hypothetical protein